MSTAQEFADNGDVLQTGIAGHLWDPRFSVEPKPGDHCDVVIPAEITAVSERGVSWQILPNRLVYYRPLDERTQPQGG